MKKDELNIGELFNSTNRTFEIQQIPIYGKNKSRRFMPSILPILIGFISFFILYSLKMDQLHEFGFKAINSIHFACEIYFNFFIDQPIN